MRVGFATLGCKVNQAETEMLEGMFQHAGYQVVQWNETADVYVINTCSVTHLGEKKSRQLIRRAKKKNPSSTVVVTGCFAQIAPDKVKEISEVDIVVGTQNRENIVDLVAQYCQTLQPLQSVADIMTATFFEEIPLLSFPSRTRGFLKIQEGCENFCSYCIIPYTRGPSRSRALTSVEQEAEKLVQAGFSEIVLVGIHLGAYGRDLCPESNLVEAMEKVLRIDGLQRLRLGSIESVEINPRMLRLMQEDRRVCRHLHLPLQAGDNEILAQMNRSYTKEEYQRLVEDLRRSIPDISITTDIIVGFPGETEEMFQNSLEFTESLGFSRIHIFPYSRREGTPAAKFSGQISESIKKQRVEQLQKIADESMRKYNEFFINSQVEVLIEEEKNGLWQGWSEQYIRIYLQGRNFKAGCIYMVDIISEYQDGLLGRCK